LKAALATSPCSHSPLAGILGPGHRGSQAPSMAFLAVIHCLPGGIRGIRGAKRISSRMSAE
jgi:hypothetical protein